MIALLDVDYRPSEAVAACVLAEDWTSASSAARVTARVRPVAEYVPGQFYKRELPCLLAVLARLSVQPDLVVVDGYVWLRDDHDPGLGAHLHRALDGRLPVVGIAKTAFAQCTVHRPVLRGASARPLYVTAAGVDPEEAARCVASMHGAHRLPTLVHEVDRLARTSGALQG